jgi:hypothetical protein
MERARTVSGFEAYLPARDNAPAPSRLPLWLFSRAESGKEKTALRQFVVSENVCKLFLVPCCKSFFLSSCESRLYLFDPFADMRSLVDWP